MDRDGSSSPSLSVGASDSEEQHRQTVGQRSSRRECRATQTSKQLRITHWPGRRPDTGDVSCCSGHNGLRHGSWAARERAQESRQRLAVAREDDKDEEQQSASVYAVEGFGSAWEDGVEFYGLCAYIGSLTGKVIYHLDQSSWKYRPPDQDFQTFDQFRGATLSQVRNEKGRYT
jgi:hypothetical protein